ncbi:MAG: zinc-binding dehydrogenase [Phycisphaerae bacterium]|jgi:threonine dehydrogenase-like Zn-dependent dehydrogenase
MKAIVYNVNPFGWLACKALSRWWPSCLLGGLNGIALEEMAPPELPTPHWVRLRTLMGGICGTDLAIIAQKQLPNSILQAYTSSPMLLGHENLAVVEEVGPAVDRSWLGRRVCVEPTLCCEAREISPPCPRCQAGQFGVCENFSANGAGAAGLPPGTSIGYNSRTGGSLGESFVAHVSRLAAVPEAIPDEAAVLTDPVACSLHAALRADLSRGGQVLVYGCGVMGLALVACLRALGYAGRIDAMDRSDYLQPLALQLGASNFLQLPAEKAGRFAAIALATGGSVQRARVGNLALSGGYDLSFDCVGNGRSVEECLKWTRGGGQMIMVGTGNGWGADLTAVWFKELEIVGCYGRGTERFDGREIGTYQLVHELMAAGKLNVSPMLTHTFPLSDYRSALKVALAKSAHRAIKVALDFRAR